jgi:tetratricopeptide (TPR) repeat protein
LKPDYAGAYCNLGIALKQLGLVNEAIEAYRHAVEVAPTVFEAHFNLGIVLNSVSHYGEALDCFRKVINLDPKSAPAHNSLGIALQAIGKIEDAIAAHQAAIRLKPDYLGAMINLAQALIKSGRPEDALKPCQDALAIDPDFAPAREILAQIHLIVGQPGASLKAAKSALEVRPDSLSARNLAAAALKALGQQDEITILYRQGILHSPKCGKLYHELVVHHLERANTKDALSVCNEWLEAIPGDTSGLAIKATVLQEAGAQGDLDQLIDFDRFLQVRELDSAPGYNKLIEFNEALSNYILQHPTLAEDPKGHATKSGRHTGLLLVEPKGPIAQLEQIISTEVQAYCNSHPLDLGHPFLARQPKSWNLHIWAVVLGAQGFQTPHIHPLAWLSGVYYAAVPSSVRTACEAKDGWIEFGGPQFEFQVSGEPKLYPVRPEPGLILLFPSYFYHRTLPSRSDELRISIAFDIVPRPGNKRG